MARERIAREKREEAEESVKLRWRSAKNVCCGCWPCVVVVGRVHARASRPCDRVELHFRPGDAEQI